MCLVLSGGISSPRQRFLPWRLNARRVSRRDKENHRVCRVHTMHFVCRGLLPWQRTANIECTSPRRGVARQRSTRLVDPSELAEELAPGCFRKLRATARVHLDTVRRRRNFDRSALIFFEISLVNGRPALLTRELSKAALLSDALRRNARAEDNARQYDVRYRGRKGYPSTLSERKYTCV